MKNNPELAAMRALEFAKEAFIDLNQPEAYSFLTEEMQRSISFDKYIDTIARMHPDKFPRVVTAIEYEPLPGKDGMIILLYGENGDEKFHYRLTIKEKSYASYKVAGMFRVAEQPPSQSRTPLPTRRSTADLR